MKTGALSKEEKLNIIKLLQDGKDTAEVSVELERSEDVVQKYLEEVRAAVEEKAEPIVPGVSEKVTSAVSTQLRQMGLTNVSINNKINRVLKALSVEQLKQLTVPQLLSDCLRLINVHDVMINKTAGGNAGVSIMTEAGSERGDSVVTQAKPAPYIYKIH